MSRDAGNWPPLAKRTMPVPTLLPGTLRRMFDERFPDPSASASPWPGVGIPCATAGPIHPPKKSGAS